MAGFRADHVGSLLTPQALRAGREAYRAGVLSAEALRGIEDRAVCEALRLQRDAGIEVLTDGELRRGGWISRLQDALDGLEPRAFAGGGRGRLGGERVANDEVPAAALAVTGPLALKQRLTAGEGDFLGRHARGPFKVAIPGPNMFLCLHQPGLSEAAYATPGAFLDALVGLCRGEVEALAGDGAAYVQLDSHIDAYLRAFGAGVLQGGSGEAEVADAIAADNAALEPARARGLTTGLHICRSAHGRSRPAAGGYGPIAELLFGLCEADRLLLEFDEEDPDAFDILRLVPRGKTVVLGLVTTCTPEAQDKDALRRQIDRAARFIEIEDLAISPQCGFPSHPGRLTEDDQKRKLELVAETARTVWG